MLFGTFVKVRYGILSLTNEGLPSYGEVCCRLRRIAIEDRTSFLECNSFKFIAQHKLTPGRGYPRGIELFGPTGIGSQ